MEPVATSSGPDLQRQYVYVWEFPVRLFHWMNALCVVVLAVSGYMIAGPLAAQRAPEYSPAGLLTIVRWMHFLTGWIWIAVAILRIYWGFVGNEFVRYRNFLPLTRAWWSRPSSIVEGDAAEIGTSAASVIGHSPLAALSYTIAFAAFLFQVITGLSVYAAMDSNWFLDLFAWVIPLFGSEHLARLWHHMTMWFFVVFMIVHVYLAAYHEYIHPTGTISSIIRGWKYVDRAT